MSQHTGTISNALSARARSVAATACVAAAALALTACGGGSDGTDPVDAGHSDQPSSSAPPTTTAAPTGSPTASVSRPVITLPKDLIDTFDRWQTGDPQKDAVLADSRQSTLAVDQAVTLAKANTAAVRFYLVGDALISSLDFIQGTVKDHVTFTGTTRYFNPRLTMFDADNAGVAYCGDETKSFSKDRKTGKKDGGGSAADPQSYVSYSTRLTKDKRGVWQTTSITSVRGGKPCAP